MHLLRKVLIAILFFAPLMVRAQPGFTSDILPSQELNHLLKSPTTITCDSLGIFRVIFTFYTDNMPMADNSKLNWSCWIGQGDNKPMDGTNTPMCLNLEVRKIFLFYEKEVYLYSYNHKIVNETLKIYSVPLFAVIEYYNSVDQKLGYLMASADSFIGYGDVE